MSTSIFRHLSHRYDESYASTPGHHFPHRPNNSGSSGGGLDHATSGTSAVNSGTASSVGCFGNINTIGMF